MTDNIRKIFDMLGVEPKEKFKLKMGDKTLEPTYYFDENIYVYREPDVPTYMNILEKILNGTYKIVKLTMKKKKLRDLTPEEYEKWFTEHHCENKHIHCDSCIFSGTNCIIKSGWINHKDLYSDKFLDQEIEVEE